MLTLLELRNKKATIVTDMEAILTKADEEKRDVTEDEEKEYEGFETSLNEVNENIRSLEKVEERKEKLAEQRAEIEKVDKLEKRSGVTVGDDLATKEDFRDIADFLYSVRFEQNDPRLVGVSETDTRESRVHQMKNGVSGGFAIPEQFRPDLLSVAPQEAIVRPRAFVIPAGDPPDAAIKMPSLDQTASQNIYGGIVVNHDGESNQITETNMRLRQIELQPRKITGYMTASNELLNNWAASSAVFERNLRLAVTGAEDTDFLIGDGVNKALGILNAPATISQARGTSNLISYTDILTMFSRMLFRGGSLVWITSQTTIPQLGAIVDAGNNNLWVQSAADNLPPTLMGIPVLFNERSPALGSAGDLILANLSQYIIKDGSGPNIAFSEHFRFQNDEGAFRITWRVDGQPQLSEPIPLEGSTSNTISPFVSLDA